MRQATVVVVAKGVELKLEVSEGACWGLLMQEAVESLVEALDLAAGLRMVGRGVLEDDAETLQLEFEKDLAPSGFGSEDRGVVTEQGSRKTVLSRSRMKHVDGVGSLDGDESHAGDRESGLVVQEVQNFHRTAVGQLPGSGVQLPGLVGEFGFETDERGLWSLVRLRGDESLAFENPPHRRCRRNLVDLAIEVMCDGLGSGVMPIGSQLGAKLDDQLLDLSSNLVGAGLRSPGARL